MTQYEEIMKWLLPKYYEQRTAKFIRVMRSSEPVMVASIASTNIVGAGGTSAAICSTTFDANTEGFLTSYGFSHTSTVAEMWLLDGTSTIVPQKIRVDALTQCQLAGINEPMYRIDASETISARTDTTGTVCAWFCMQKFPTFVRAETEGY